MQLSAVILTKKSQSARQTDRQSLKNLSRLSSRYSEIEDFSSREVFVVGTNEKIKTQMEYGYPKII